MALAGQADNSAPHPDNISSFIMSAARAVQDNAAERRQNRTRGPLKVL